MTLKTHTDVELKEIAQIAFTVNDLAEAKTFYQEILGLKFLFDAGTMAFFQCGTIRVMIGQGEKPSGSEGTIAYFRVADLEATSSSLESCGIAFLQKPHLVARMKSHDLWMAFVKDPAGNTLGLMSELERGQ
ncbi:VOC family protein [Terriglobus saanensis]|uniref:Glyoxalase/bleomycin resistance protein/dioxygenase n=1 Tax=Terriglobus saanensis (strain ATCC BAA-1853 / DSM 23119 / SP1PR4) TaxID=401053 RepID=E8V3B0_TERSS|nr:VOC family protein [Terriglobus saanensis]ADV82467.1 Glyoxalase/bleomycin resistance protein/dioxygenase [Terriglobus saanensis SP1PR4]